MRSISGTDQLGYFRIRIFTKIVGALVVIAAALAPFAIYSQGTAFTYQGRLNSYGTPANGTFDFVFSAYDVAAAGNLVVGRLPMQILLLPFLQVCLFAVLEVTDGSDGFTKTFSGICSAEPFFDFSSKRISRDPSEGIAGAGVIIPAPAVALLSLQHY